MRLTRIIKCIVIIFLIGFNSVAKAVVVDSLFGWNYVGIEYSDPDAQIIAKEAHLLRVIYTGATGTSGFALPSFPGVPGMPDGIGLVNAPTFTTVKGGDGETTGTVGMSIPIDWGATSSGIPDIVIREFTFDIPGLGLHDAVFGNLYLLGLIPPGPDTELCSNLFAPQGDIYGRLACNAGNPIGTARIVSGRLAGGTIDVIFGAKAVPVPAAIWLFGTALIAFIGISRRRKIV